MNKIDQYIHAATHDVEELYKLTLLVRDSPDYRTDRYSERNAVHQKLQAELAASAMSHER
ncbi:hypothetical protein [Herminiimonas aquatilis]|uniref:Uncharacterized protein n=1 Tax=Herminiimonas aquatilis TaxID=345342 RepID=A0ABW2J7F6_9BURK